MSVDIDRAIGAMNELMEKKVTYSMEGSRVGIDGTADCSGAIYSSLRKAGASDAGWILNTDSMHEWLVQNDFSCIAQNTTWNMKRGDVIIFGPKGSSGGAAGHIVMAIDEKKVIHCNYNANGISINSETEMPYTMEWYVYRLEIKNLPSANSATSDNRNGIAIDNINFSQAQMMVSWLQNRYSGILLREQVQSKRQRDNRITLVIIVNSAWKSDHTINRLKQELATFCPGYMQENIAIVDGDKEWNRIEARNLTQKQSDKMLPHMRSFLKDILLSDQVYGEENSYGSWDVRIRGEGFTNEDIRIVLREIQAEGSKVNIPSDHIKTFKY